MIRSALALAALVVLAACDSGPNLGANIELNGGDVKVRPSVSGKIGGIGVSVSP